MQLILTEVSLTAQQSN